MTTNKTKTTRLQYNTTTTPQQHDNKTNNSTTNQQQHDTTINNKTMTTNNNTTTTTQKNNTDNKTMVLLLTNISKVTLFYCIPNIFVANSFVAVGCYSCLLYTKYFYCKRFCSCRMLLLFIVYQKSFIANGFVAV